ncbi:MAG: replicative DNA helicase [Candidatus Cloacimonadota bacterium]|nr:MAG: replicative DNA helicase [Candidatus Cloacimonadota bacterium]
MSEQNKITERSEKVVERTERMLPQDINAEAAVLSAMIVDNESVPKALELLEEKFFYKSAHKMIFKAMTSLFEENIEIDIITLIDKLYKDGTLEKCGGKIYINELSDIVLSGANISYHANIVLEKAILRLLITASNNIIETSYKAERDVEEIVDYAEQTIFKIAERPNQKGFVKINDIIPLTLQNIENAASMKSGILGVPSGFPDLDEKIGGFRPGQLIVLAARPAMGKTAFALNLAFNAAMFNDKSVGIFTMEMAADELLLRMISSASEVAMDSLLKGFGIDQEKMLKISQVASVLNDKNIFIDDTGTNTPLDIRAKCRRLKSEYGLDLVIIDYLQLMSSSGNYRDNRQQEIAEISRSLKILAKELNCPVLALSQLNRGLESRDDKRPKLSDLRESGAIEQDADVVTFIYRDEVYNQDTAEKGLAEIIIGKNRHGAIGKVELTFLGQYTSFRSRAPEIYEMSDEL